MSQTLYTLAVLACPVGMGLMMFMMMRGQNQGPAGQGSGGADASEVAALRAEIEQLKATHAADTPQQQPR